MGVCNCSMFCCMLLYVRSSIAIKRGINDSFLYLSQSSAKHNLLAWNSTFDSSLLRVLISRSALQSMTNFSRVRDGEERADCFA